MVKNSYEIGRYEFKYLLPTGLRDEILDFVQPHVRPDPHAQPINGGFVGYVVHSLYFDTPQLDDYFERLERKRIRNRLRVRTYGEPGQKQPVFPENKRKSGKWVVKHRVRVCDAEAWCSSDVPRPWTSLARRISGRGEFAARSFCQLVDGGGRRPVTVVRYEREVLIPRGRDEHHVRLTLDHHVRGNATNSASELYGSSDLLLVPPDCMVMELKFERTAPRWMAELCHRLGAGPVPVTKFGLSVARGIRSDRPHELTMLTPKCLDKPKDRV